MTRDSSDKSTRSDISRRGLLIGGAAAAGVAASFKINPIGYAKAQGAGNVTLYTSLNSEFSNQLAERFNSSNTQGVTVQVFYTQARELRQRVVAENTAGRVLHDVVEFSSLPGFVELKQNGWLLEYRSPEAAAYAPQYVDPDGFFTTGRSGPIGYGFNSSILTKPRASWKDFADPELAGKIGGADPRTVEGATIWYYCTRTHPDLGLPFWQELAALNMRTGTSYGQVVSLMLSGEVPMVQNSIFNLYTAKYTDGAPVEIVYPTEVVPMSVTPIGISAAAQNPEGAKVFVDWWLSREGQEAIRDINGANSPRSDVDILPNTPRNDEIAAMVPDINDLMAHQEEYHQEFLDLFNLR
jgi:iron(III) transport system substrate-binding protein